MRVRNVFLCMAYSIISGDVKILISSFLYVLGIAVDVMVRPLWFKVGLDVVTDARWLVKTWRTKRQY
jgi:hypothetical protein